MIHREETDMDDDLYKVLGVARTASKLDIRTAYRNLAKQFHPDLHPGDKKSEEMFKKISAANEILGNKETRAKYDQGERNASEAKKAEPSYRNYADGHGAFRYHQGSAGADYGNFSDLFGDMFASQDAARDDIRFAGGDIRYHMTVEFLEAVNGTAKRVTLPDGRTLDVTIPPGLLDGQVLRLSGQGMPGVGGGPAGNALVEVAVRSHPFFRREGVDIHMDLSISLAEAILGAKIAVPTIAGKVTLTAPKGSNSKSVLRLKGKGVVDKHKGTIGDQYVTLTVMLPTVADDELESFVRKWSQEHPYEARCPEEVKT